MADKFHGNIKTGALSVSIPVALYKTSDGTKQTGIAAASVTASYWRQGGTPTAITVAALASATAAFSAGGWFEVSNTLVPGDFRLDVPDAAFAAGADWVLLCVQASGCFPYEVLIPLESAGSSEIFTRLGLPTLASIAADIQTRSSHSALDVWNILKTAAFAANSLGAKIAPWVLGADGKVLLSTDAQTGVVIPTVTTLSNAPANSPGVVTLLDRIGSILTITNGKVDISDKSGFSLSVAGVKSIWDSATNSLTTAGSIGKWILDKLDINVGSRSTFAGGAVQSVTDAVTLPAGVATEATALAAKTAATAAKTSADAAKASADAAKLSADEAARPEDVQVTVSAPVVTVNPTPVTVNPTSVTVNPTPVTVNPTLTPAQASKLDAVATTAAHLDAMIEGDAFTEEAFQNAPSGGGGTGGLTADQNAALLRIDENAQSVRDRLAEQVPEPLPIAALPAWTPPPGLIRVLLRPTFLGVPTTADVRVYYHDQKNPHLPDSVEMVKQFASFKANSALFGPYLGLLMPVSEALYFANCKDAALSKDTAPFKVLESDSGFQFLDELIEEQKSA